MCVCVHVCVYVCVCLCACVWLLGKELIEQQSKVENVDCLPTLSVSDIERHAERDPFVVKHKGYLLYHSCYIAAVLSVHV